MAYIVEMEKIRKRYGKAFALDNISLSLEKGKIYGLLGVNGAGKTTMLRVITGLIPSFAGTLRLFGSTRLGEGRKKTGAAIEYPILFEDLTALGNLEMFQTACKMEKRELEELLRACGLENNTKAVRKFSLGMRQKLALAIALMGSPELVILDEPTNGLDPVAVKELRNLIVKWNKESGVSFLVSSHDVNELIKISDCFLLMRSGKIQCEMNRQKLAAAAAEKGLQPEEYIIGLMEKTDE